MHAPSLNPIIAAIQTQSNEMEGWNMIIYSHTFKYGEKLTQMR